MRPNEFKRTKIIATVGPATSSPAQLEALLKAGANGLRLNFAHGTHAEHLAVITAARQAAVKLGRAVAIIQDLQGPKIRVGQLPTAGVRLERGGEVRLKYGANYDRQGILPIQFDFSSYVKPGSAIFLRDGQIQVEIVAVRRRVIYGQVVTAGILFSNQGINLPDANLAGDILTKKDLADIKFGLANDIDYVALSFVQDRRDIDLLKRRLKRAGSDMPVIAKIETKAAIENLEGIVAACDGVMVARGDLAVETRPEAVPILQQRIIKLARSCQKPVIVATQMLDSMIKLPQPTRAEVSDVAAAVMQRADAVMLSSESAVGDFPIEAVSMMKRIIRYTEAHGRHELKIDFGDPSTQQNAISAAAIVLARQIQAQAIVAETTTGQTARNLASFRPPVPIVMATDQRRVYQQLAIVWGSWPYLLQTMVGATEDITAKLKTKGYARRGDTVVVAAGRQPGVSGGTDTVQVRLV